MKNEDTPKVEQAPADLKKYTDLPEMFEDYEDLAN